MTPEETKALLERYYADNSIPAEKRQRERMMYEGAASSHKLMLGISLVSAFTGATVCERPFPVGISLAVTLGSLLVAKLASSAMSETVRTIQKIYGRHP